MSLNIFKILNFKSSLAILIISIVSLFYQAPIYGQVNGKLLSDVIKSCQRDMNTDYFEKMGISSGNIGNISRERRVSMVNEILKGSTGSCIWFRYRHLALLKLLPWLPSSGEILPGYSGTVAVSMLSSSNFNEDRLIACLSYHDPERIECEMINRLWKESFYITIYRRDLDLYSGFSELPIICPNCVIAHDDSSIVEIKRGFLNWFLSLDKTKRKEVLSFFLSYKIREQLDKEAITARQIYNEALKKAQEDDKKRLRENLLGK